MKPTDDGGQLTEQEFRWFVIILLLGIFATTLCAALAIADLDHLAEAVVKGFVEAMHHDAH